jgi:hypothetical protein
MPKPLSLVAPGAIPIFVPRDFAKRPALAALVAETISTWSYAEHALGRSLAGMSRGSSTAAMKRYAETRRFSGKNNSKKEILAEAAKTHLLEPYRGTFLCVMDIVSDYASKRHEFAHHIWGSVEELPDAVLLVHPKYLFGHWGAANDWIVEFAAHPGKAGTPPKFITDLARIMQRVDRYAGQNVAVA